MGMDLSDESLLAGLASGDTGVAAAFVRRYQRRVYGLALTIVGSATVAEDVAQEAFVRVWRNAGAYDARRGGVASWVLTITRNVAIDALRLRAEQPIDPQVLLTSLLSDRAGGERAVAQVYEDREQLRDALGALPQEQGRLIVLSVFCGLTAKEAAAAEGIPLGTAKTRIRRGLAKLREVMGVSS